jgi:DNA recombination protein RmuC
MRLDCSAHFPLSSNRQVASRLRQRIPHLYVNFTIALTAAFVGFAIGWLWQLARQAALRERLANRDEAEARLAAEANAARAEVLRLTTLQAQAATQLAAEREAHERLGHEFQALSATALQSNNAAFLDLARETFAKLQAASSGDLEKRQQAIEAMVRPLRESLDKVGQSVAEIDKARADAYGRLSEQLKSLGTAQGLLQAEAGKLSTALRSTTTAGTWGELQLRRVVELAGMTAYCDFAEQQTSGSFRPDLVVRLPGGLQVIVDAKAPNEAYREAANASEESVRAARLADHAAKVRSHIDTLGSKNYWEQFQPSPEFVVLFLPGDQFLAGALQADPGLIDRAIAKKVLLATPATLIALLKAAHYGWRQEDVARNATVIADLGRALYDRIANFADNLDKVGRGLETANKAYNAAVGSFEQTVLPGARKFSELGAKGAKELTDGPAVVEVTPRDVLKRG